MVERVGDREQDTGAVEREDVDDGEVLRDVVVDLHLGGQARHDLLAQDGRAAGLGDHFLDVEPAGQHLADGDLNAFPALVVLGNRRAVEMGDAEHVDHRTAAAGGDARRRCCPTPQHAGQLGEQARAVAGDDGELAELALGEVRDRGDQRLLDVPAHELEVLRDVLLRPGEEVAIRHVGEKPLDGIAADRAEHRGDALADAVGALRLRLLDGDAALEALQRQPIQLAQQHVLPAVPQLRIGRAEVGEGEDVELLQGGRRADGAGEVADELGVVDVAARRQVMHQQMLAHEQLELRDVVVVHPEAFGHAGRHVGALVGVIAPQPFAGIVEQHGEVQHLDRRPRASPGWRGGRADCAVQQLLEARPRAGCSSTV